MINNAMGILIASDSEIHMNELTEGAVEIESYTDYLAGIEDYDARAFRTAAGIV